MIYSLNFLEVKLTPPPLRTLLRRPPTAQCTVLKVYLYKTRPDHNNQPSQMIYNKDLRLCYHPSDIQTVAIKEYTCKINCIYIDRERERERQGDRQTETQPKRDSQRETAKEKQPKRNQPKIVKETLKNKRKNRRGKGTYKYTIFLRKITRLSKIK